MDAKELVCTDIYVIIFFQAELHEFILTETGSRTAMCMKEVFRDEESIVYYSSCHLNLDDEETSFIIDQAHHAAPTFFLSSSNVEDAISQQYPQFAPENGSISLSDSSVFIPDRTHPEVQLWLPKATASKYISTDCGILGFHTSIELHCCPRVDDV